MAHEMSYHLSPVITYSLLTKLYIKYIYVERITKARKIFIIESHIRYGRIINIRYDPIIKAADCAWQIANADLDRFHYKISREIKIT